METKALPLNSPVYLIIRYHSDPVAFATLAAAEEFAQYCGDYCDLIKPLFPAQDEVDHYDSYDHDWNE